MLLCHILRCMPLFFLHLFHRKSSLLSDISVGSQKIVTIKSPMPSFSWFFLGSKQRTYRRKKNDWIYFEYLVVFLVHLKWISIVWFFCWLWGTVQLWIARWELNWFCDRMQLELLPSYRNVLLLEVETFSLPMFLYLKISISSTLEGSLSALYMQIYII